jgi:hypothetical protein
MNFNKELALLVVSSTEILSVICSAQLFLFEFTSKNIYCMSCPIEVTTLFCAMTLSKLKTHWLTCILYIMLCTRGE